MFDSKDDRYTLSLKPNIRYSCSGEIPKVDDHHAVPVPAALDLSGRDSIPGGAGLQTMAPGRHARTEQTSGQDSWNQRTIGGVVYDFR